MKTIEENIGVIIISILFLCGFGFCTYTGTYPTVGYAIIIGFLYLYLQVILRLKMDVSENKVLDYILSFIVLLVLIITLYISNPGLEELYKAAFETSSRGISKAGLFNLIMLFAALFDFGPVNFIESLIKKVKSEQYNSGVTDEAERPYNELAKIEEELAGISSHKANLESKQGDLQETIAVIERNNNAA